MKLINGELVLNWSGRLFGLIVDLVNKIFVVYIYRKIGSKVFRLFLVGVKNEDVGVGFLV